MRTFARGDGDAREAVVELDRHDLHPSQRRGGLRWQGAGASGEDEQNGEPFHRSSGTRP